MRRLLTFGIAISLFLALSVEPLRAAIAFVQTASAGSSAVTITGVTGGNLLIWCGTAGDDVTALSDDRGDTWTQVAAEEYAAGLAASAIWYAKNATSGTHVVTRTGGFGSFEYYSISEYSGMDTTAPFDVSASDQWTTGFEDPDSGVTATTAQADELIFGCVGNPGAKDHLPWKNSFTSRGSGSQGSRIAQWGDLTVSSTGTYKAQMTAVGGGGSAWLALVATFKMASAGPSGPPLGSLLLGGVGK